MERADARKLTPHIGMARDWYLSVLDEETQVGVFFEADDETAYLYRVGQKITEGTRITKYVSIPMRNFVGVELAELELEWRVNDTRVRLVRNRSQELASISIF